MTGSHRAPDDKPYNDPRRAERIIDLKVERRAIMAEVINPWMWMPPLVALVSASAWTYGNTFELRQLGSWVFWVAMVGTLFVVGQVGKDLAATSWEIHQLQQPSRVVEPDGSAVYRGSTWPGGSPRTWGWRR